ncbi:hypothetical protein [Streptomyces sp. NPDC054865]
MITTMRSKLALLVALALLAIAFPSAALLIFQALSVTVAGVFIAVAWVQAHLSLVCFVGAVVLLARTYPDTFRRAVRGLARSVVDAVRFVMAGAATDSTAAASGSGKPTT